MKLKDFPKYELSGINRHINISRCVPQPNISLHLKNIYKEKELDLPSTTEVFSVVEMEG